MMNLVEMTAYFEKFREELRPFNPGIASFSYHLPAQDENADIQLVEDILVDIVLHPDVEPKIMIRWIENVYLEIPEEAYPFNLVRINFYQTGKELETLYFCREDYDTDIFEDHLRNFEEDSDNEDADSRLNWN
jgi:hypothetical protein